MNQLQTFDLSMAQTSYTWANERLYKLIENFDIQNQKSIIKTQIEHNEERTSDLFDEVFSSKQQPSSTSGAIFHPYQYWAPFEFQANARHLKCTGCINRDGSINDNLPYGSARKLIATIALNLKNSQAEDGFHHMIGLQQCIKYKTAAGIQVDCQTVIDDLNRAAYEDMVERRATKNKPQKSA
jgi:5-methylcytosine-specific restriction endonuclease McrBC regulatory subunit McrC